MASQVFLLYAGFLADTLFIRLTHVMGAVMVCVWNNLGAAAFPNFFNDKLPGIKVDAMVWCALSIFVNGTPAFRQLLYNDSKVKFGAPYEETKEAMWRSWFRRTGISRADFKIVLSAGMFIEMLPDTPVPMEEGEKEANCSGQLGDLYYYVASGHLVGFAKY